MPMAENPDLANDFYEEKSSDTEIEDSEENPMKELMPSIDYR